MPGPVFLRGETVDLHPIEEEDLPFAQRLVNDERVRRTLAVYAPKNRTQEEAWLDSHDDDNVRLLACGYAFRERRLNKVHEGVYAVNPASARVLEKVGFQQEGTLRQHAFVDGEYVDVLYYGLLAEEFEG